MVYSRLLKKLSFGLTLSLLTMTSAQAQRDFRDI